jgi:hypothetical protein
VLELDIEEAIETLKNAFKCNKKQFEEIGTHILLQDDEQEAIETLLTAYEKEKEKNKELENKNNKLMEELDLTTVYISGVYDGEKKVEDKIKAKIEEVKDGTYDAKIVLQSL